MTQQTRQSHDQYIWFDAEYSSVELEDAVLLQVAVLATDSSLHRVLPQEQDVRLVIRAPEGARFSPWVEENLPGLALECRSREAIDVAEADERLAAYVDATVAFRSDRGDHRPFLAGNSIHFDWWLARRFLPLFLGRLHYRQLDVSSFKLEWKRAHPATRFDKTDPNTIRTYFPEAFINDSANRHDAYYDLQASIAELAFYRQHFFI